MADIQRPSLVNIFQKSKPELDSYQKASDNGEQQPLTVEEKAALGGALDVMVNYVVGLQGSIAPGGGKSFLKELNVSANDPNRAKYVTLFRAVTEMNPNDNTSTLTEKVEQDLMKDCPATRPSLINIYQEAKARLDKFMFNDNGTERLLSAKEKTALVKAIDTMIALIKAGQDKIAPTGGSNFLKVLNISANDPDRAKYVALFRAVTEMNPNDTTVTVTEQVEKKLMESTCVKPPVAEAKMVAVTVSGVTPYEVKPGDEVELTVTGENLDRVTSIDLPTSFKDLPKPEISADGKQMKFQKVRVPLGAQPGISEFVLYGGEDGDEKLTSFTVNILEGDSRTAFEKAGDYVANTLKAKGEVAFGLSTYPSVSQKVPYNLTALGDREMPNLKMNLRLGSIDEPVTIIGRGHAIVPGNRVELLGNAQAGAQDTVHSGPDDYRLNAGLGLGVRGNFWAERRLAFSLYADSGIIDNSHRAPNKFFYNGSDKYLNLRATLDSDFRTDWLLAGIFGERQFSSFNWDGNSFPGGFSGQTEKWQLGLLGSADLTQRSDLAPKVDLKASWLVSGRTAVPDSLAGFAYEKLSGVEAEARVDFKKMPKLPFYLFGGLSHLSQDGDNWGAVSRYFFGAGVKPQSIGKLEARGDFADNPALYYGGSAKFGTLAWTLPERWLQASGLTVKLQGFQIDQQTGVNGMVSLDLVPTIFGPIKTAPADK